MKLKAPLCFVIFFFCHAAVAQVLIGPTAGAQVSWITFDDKDYKDTLKVQSHVGFNAGFNLSFRVRKRFFLHTSVVYSTKGYTIRGTDTPGNPDLKDKVRNNYIEVPILYTYEIKTHVGPNKEFKWYFGVGPNISYWLSGKGRLEGQASLNEAHVEFLDYKMAFDQDITTAEENQLVVTDPNRIQLGLNLSAGFVFEPMGYSKIMFTIRYEAGHSFFSQNMGIFPNIPDYNSVLRARNNGFRFSLAYLIDLKTEDRKKGKSTINKKKLR